MGWNRKSASLITQSVLIVSIENSFVLALIRSLQKVQKKTARHARRAGFYIAMFIKVGWYFLFLIHYSLNFQYPVTNFTLTCSLKNSHHNDTKLFLKHLLEIHQRQI